MLKDAIKRGELYARGRKKSYLCRKNERERGHRMITERGRDRDQCVNTKRGVLWKEGEEGVPAAVKA